MSQLPTSLLLLSVFTWEGWVPWSSRQQRDLSLCYVTERRWQTGFRVLKRVAAFPGVRMLGYSWMEKLLYYWSWDMQSLPVCLKSLLSLKMSFSTSKVSVLCQWWFRGRERACSWSREEVHLLWGVPAPLVAEWPGVKRRGSGWWAGGFHLEMGKAAHGNGESRGKSSTSCTWG